MVDFILYLRALHWSAVATGELLAAAAIVSTALMLASGVLSDRLGRRPFLVGYQLVTIVGSTAMVLHPHAWVLIVVCVLLGYGRGANGSAGAFGPVEQAWLAQAVERPKRGQVFSINGALGFWGMGIGALIGSAVPWFRHFLPGNAAYQPLFVLSCVIAVINTAQVLSIRGADLPPRTVESSVTRTKEPVSIAPADASVRQRENVAMTLLTTVNSVNALGIGLFSPLLPYWLSVRFGVGNGAIGSVYGITFLLTGVASIATGELTTKIGLVRSVVWVRLGGVLTLAVMPLMPSFRWVAVLYVVRSLLNRGTAGVRQAFGVGLVRDERKGLASSLNGLSMRLPSAIGPAITGWLIDNGSLDLPFYLAAGLQLLYLVLFGTLMRPYASAPEASGT